MVLKYIVCFLLLIDVVHAQKEEEGLKCFLVTKPSIPVQSVEVRKRKLSLKNRREEIERKRENNQLLLEIQKDIEEIVGPDYYSPNLVLTQDIFVKEIVSVCRVLVENGNFQEREAKEVISLMWRVADSCREAFQAVNYISHLNDAISQLTQENPRKNKLRQIAQKYAIDIRMHQELFDALQQWLFPLR